MNCDIEVCYFLWYLEIETLKTLNYKTYDTSAQHQTLVSIPAKVLLTNLFQFYNFIY